MDGEDGLSFLSIGEGDKKDLVKTTLSQDLRGKEFNHIGCGGDKDENAFFLHPGEKGGKDPGLGSSSGLLALNADPCFNLIDPENTGGHRFCSPKGNLQRLFRFSNCSVIKPR